MYFNNQNKQNEWNLTNSSQLGFVYFHSFWILSSVLVEMGGIKTIILLILFEYKCKIE